MEALKERMCCYLCQYDDDKKMLKTRKSNSEVARFLLNIAISFLMVLFVNQAYKAWDKYSKGDTMMVSKLLELDKREFPSVSLCKGMLPGKYNSSIEEGYEFNAKLDNWLLYAKFQNKTLNLSSTTFWQFRNASRHLFVNMPPGFNCHTFTSPEEVLPGIVNGLILHMAVNDSDFIFLVLHDSLQNIPAVDDIFGNTVMSISAPADGVTQHIKDMAVDTEMTKQLGTDSAPCEDECNSPSGSGLQECLENSFEEEATCVLPWKYKESNSNGKTQCNATKLNDFESFMMDITEKPTFSHVYTKTKCTHPCEQLTFSYKVPFELIIPKEYDYNVNIRIYLKPSGVTHKKEVVVFDALEMIGNIGGYLGLLLGWSVLPIFNAGCIKVMKLE